MNTATRWLTAAGVMAALLAVPARARGGDAPDDPASAAQRVAAAALESANLRAKAKIEEARILDGLARHEEALAALAEVEAIEKEGRVLAERLLVPAVPERLRPPRTALRVQVIPPPAAPPRAEGDVPQSSLWLASMQRIDGWFRPVPPSEAPADADLDEGHDAVVTALASVALFDLVEDGRSNERYATAARRGVAALVAALDPKTGGLAGERDFEAQALAAWAIATGYSRTGEAGWREPVRATIAFLLEHRDDRGLWRSASGTADDDAVLAAWVTVALHEAMAMPRLVEGMGLPDVLALAAKASEALGGEGLASPAAKIARALVVKPVQAAISAPGNVMVEEGGRVYATALVLGTAAVRGTRDDAAMDRWKEESLLPALRTRVDSGPLAGSWAGADSRSKAHGRTYSTACTVLAWQALVVPWRAPIAD